MRVRTRSLKQRRNDMRQCERIARINCGVIKRMHDDATERFGRPRAHYRHQPNRSAPLLMQPNRFSLPPEFIECAELKRSECQHANRACPLRDRQRHVVLRLLHTFLEGVLDSPPRLRHDGV